MGETEGNRGLVNYVPAQGDFITIDVTIGATGREQQGYRRALVISIDRFNEIKGLVILCPITNTDRNDPLHIRILDGLPVTGFILVDQVRSIDYVGRRVEYVASCPQKLFQQVQEVLAKLIFQSFPAKSK